MVYRSQTVSQLRRFLGMINYYGRFIPHCAEILSLFDYLLKNLPKGRHPVISWSSEASLAFSNIKSALTTATLLNFPQIRVKTAHYVDASNTACGAVLQQRTAERHMAPLEYFSASSLPLNANIVPLTGNFWLPT